MSDPITREQFVERIVRDALKPHAAALPEWAVEEMRRTLELLLESHPVAATLVDRARPRAIPDESAARPKDDGDEAGEELAQRRRGA